MKILAIETSCDETGISILEAKGTNTHLRHGVNVTFKILANELSSQAKLHAQFGGVYPSLAKREHIKNLPILLEKIFTEANIIHKRNSAQAGEPSKVKIQQNFIRAESGKNICDIITVTSGPGLEPCLWAGIVFAEELGKEWKVPVVPVNHMEGHILSVFGKNKGKFKVEKPTFPALSLLVSGGHTELVLVKDFGKYEVIGETLDDAAGEAFDKVARMLELPYPGGPEISKLSEKARILDERTSSQRDGARKAIRQQADMRGESGRNPSFQLPRPMIKSKNFDFSFSGLKTAVLYLIRDLKKEHSNILTNIRIKSEIALEFENAAVETLVYKTKVAAEKYGVKTIIVGGGVAGNKHLQREIKKEFGKSTKVLFPGHGLSTDNSIMIGMAGYLKYLENPKKRYKIKAEGGLRL